MAGRFYDVDPARLSRSVTGVLGAASGNPWPDLRAVIVPHAGHVYSGPVAASAYRVVDPRRFERVVLLGPAHYVRVSGIAATSAQAWASPLGEVPVDGGTIARLVATGWVDIDDRAHAPEHCLEVQLPFLQVALGIGWSLVPMLVGHAPRHVVADVIDAVSAPGTLLVVSTDLSHYLPYEAARSADEVTARHIVALAPTDIGDSDACGAYALRGGLEWARRSAPSVTQLDVRNSGDTAGPRDRVVGYGAFAIHG